MNPTFRSDSLIGMGLCKTIREVEKRQLFLRRGGGGRDGKGERGGGGDGCGREDEEHVDGDDGNEAEDEGKEVGDDMSNGGGERIGMVDVEDEAWAVLYLYEVSTKGLDPVGLKPIKVVESNVNFGAGTSMP
ncbi:hypothetical protein L1987_40735 [Smallanthus sonchifolius]|uniref:Uncharacterized protein n=1 Tax=Smallanthus sonchifolius TaxID=185202 RepID=A0ACB9GUD8_9ASTR|nr:hypothetical protein L1987_40735 [Smallanthus sonchifolius]